MASFQLEESVTTPRLGSDISDALVELAARTRETVVFVRRGRRAAGSGVIWRSDGIIMTNQHVVAGHGQARVRFSDNRELPASVIASDPALDLAVLKVATNNLPAAPVAAVPVLRVGQLVLAVGNPWGQRGVVTMGIISGLGEVQAPWRAKPAEYIRSDVLLAPGNSGGALLDMHGRVIGINAMIFGGDLSVAIPSHVATQFVSLHERRPMLGVGVRSVVLPADLALQLHQQRALQVVEVLADGPVARAGCRAGDLLLTLGGLPLTDAQSLQTVLGQHTVGERVALECIQNGRRQTLMVELQGMPTVEVAA